MVTPTLDPTAVEDAARTPTVLVVLVVSNGARWLRETLRSLAEQTHTRLAVVAVDNGSTDGSREILDQALGPGRVLVRTGDDGLSGALRAALDLPAATAADFVLVLHDDAALAPEAVSRMVEAARMRSIERVGIVGPKVVDWEDPRVLREVGRSTDRFGHPHTPLQDGEMDQGQYDRILEVLYVSSCAMLIARDAWQRTGSFDERYDGHHDDLDFCWRARVAGFRVLMTPLAQARHRGAGARGERREPHRHGPQYLAERAALASMLKDYAALSLLWLLPLYAVIGVVRLLYLAITRRLEEAYELLSAWAWNIVHLPSTIRRRVRAQSVRAAPDRSVRRFMESAFFRIPRWFQEAERILEEQIELEEEPERPPVRRRFASLASRHPVFVAAALGLVVGAFAYRSLIGPQVLTGGVLAAFPSVPKDFFAELVSGIRTTVLGGTQAASPALGGLGGLSGLLLASTALAQKVLIAVLPPAAAVVLYRSLHRQTRQRAPSVIAGAAYALSAVIFWAFSQGRIDLLVAAVVLPAVADRLDGAFARQREGPSFRFMVGLGAVVAIGMAFSPSVLLALVVLLLVQLIAGRSRARGLGLVLGSMVVAGLLVAPMLPAIVSAPGAELSSLVGLPRFAWLARLAPGTGPGTWPIAWFVPLAAVVAFSVVGEAYRARAWRSVFTAIAGVFLAWVSAAGYLPHSLTNAAMYILLAAGAEAAVIGYGLATIGSGIEREAFGYRQVAVGIVALVLGVGFVGQSFQAVLGNWAIGPNGLPSAWPVISGSPGDFRVVWVGAPRGDPLPAPGGDPQGIVDAGAASVRFSVADKEGISALDTGRGEEGAGYDYLQRALAEILAGGTSHGGALLAPLGIRFVVAADGDLPPDAASRLDAQLDIDRIPAGGLIIYQNERALPDAFVTSSAPFTKAAGGADLERISSVPPPDVTPLAPVQGGFEGASSGGFGFLSQQDDGGWEAQTGGRTVHAETALGWAIGFPAAPGPVRITYADQWIRTTEIWILAVLWLAVAWITRRPGAR
jgi:GT2 family glycosyltransferase